MNIKGYKAFDQDFKCRGYQFEVGKTYTNPGELIMCKSGFHFCLVPIECDHYYPYNRNTRYAEILAGNNVLYDGDKCVTGEITIVREINRNEIITLSTGWFKFNNRQEHWLNGKRHCDGGPAVKYPGRREEWWMNGERHRQDGPAIKASDDEEWWLLNGKVHREDGPAIIRSNGCEEWFLNGQKHRKNGPAVKYPNGEEWYLNGERHRDDGPAIKNIDGEQWNIHGVIHRTDGPAIQTANGAQTWYLNGRVHREDGPAMKYVDGREDWWKNGVKIDEPLKMHVVEK